MYTFIIEGYDSDKETWLKNLGAGYIEELDMSLEEFYIALEARKGESWMKKWLKLNYKYYVVALVAFALGRSAKKYITHSPFLWKN